ncbi:lipopolysaccharide-induced tumor necrosis factor-alpha factor homolog [Aricia agestis]|uniref:lipopolysaccharide-induced tumor necrosis factor-alpha factor homolog n=1 Tax=Aricia agestis TaxID=91739 RepID=UPI001C204EA3|nr:lipopolysaccharide-induced tumor necrosis factor-alpha factor homolog [Aricia agestis]
MAAQHPQGNPPPYPGPPPANYPQPGSYPQPGNYPHPQPGNYTHPQPQQPVTVVYPANTAFVQGARVIPAVVVSNHMGTDPSHFVCRSCNQHVITRLERRPAVRTHLFALLLCVLGFWPCVCLPYCMDSCNNADHYCPNCDSYIGSYVG